MNHMDMNREQGNGKRDAIFFVVGVGLLGLTLFAPDAGHHWGLGFIQVLRRISWDQPFDWPAVWCSVKILILCLGLGLLIEGLAIWLMKRGFELMSFLVCFLHLMPLLGSLAGGYYLIKSLL